jgi:hypothetical protein
MAFSSFTPGTRVVLAQDGKSFRIYDDSEWNGESGSATAVIVQIKHIDDDDVEIDYDNYPLINPGDDSKYLEYLSTDGHVVNTSDLTIDGIAASEQFPDGYYEIKVVYTDGSYAEGSEPYFTNVQGFLAKYRWMKRTMPALLLEWPITDAVRRKNDDIYSLGLYLDAAEYAATLEQMVMFRKFVELIRKVVDHYEVAEPW